MLTKNDILNVSNDFLHLEDFVDRTAETNQFQSLVDKRYEERDEYKRIIAFYGQAGIGKTVLLDRLEFECIRKKISYSRINFESGIYNNTIEILREIVRELDPQKLSFNGWRQLDQYWFSSGLAVTELNVNVQGQEGGFNFQGANLNVGRDMAGGDMVAGSKVEIKNNTFNVSNMPTRAALDPLGAQTALTESFIKALGEFVQEQPAVILFEGLDHEYCSIKTRIWLDGLLDKIRGLKGFGVLPVATYFNAPNYEAKLRKVTLRAELKPLSLEHVIEYFRTRRIPENIIMDAARACIEDTQGIPARVYEYAENIISDLDEELTEAPVQNVPMQVQEEPVAQAQSIESTILGNAPALVAEAVEQTPQNIPVEIADEPAAIEQKPADDVQGLVREEQSVSEIAVEEIPEQVEEAPEAIERTNEAAFDQRETGQPVLEEEVVASEVNPPAQETLSTETGRIEQPAEVADQPGAPEAISQPAEEVRADSETSQPVQENLSIETEAEKVEQSEAVVEQTGTLETIPEHLEEVKADSETKVSAPEVPTVGDVATTERTEVAETQASLQPTQPTPEEEQRSEAAFRRSQERMKRLKSEGKSSTANMVDSLLGRLSNEVADLARRCAVLRWFTVDLIIAIAEHELNPEQAAEILNTISGWPFVQDFGYGTYAYRKEIQQYLRSQMQVENPELYADIIQKAQVYFEKKLGSTDTSDEMVWINLPTEQATALRENLYYLLIADPKRGFDLLGKLFQSAQRLSLQGEAAILVKFAKEVDKSTLSENNKNQLSYFEAALEFSEGNAVSAESKLRELLTKPLSDELNAQVLGQLGVILVRAEKYDEAIKAFEQAQGIWKKLNRERERAKLSNNLGNVYMRKNDLNRAERSFNEALDGLKKAETPAEAALTLNNVGGLLSGLTKVVSASELTATLNKFGSLIEGLKKTAAPSERAQTLNNLGNVYLQKENWTKALEYYQKSLEIKTSIGDQFGAANTYSNFGTVYQRMAQETSGKKQVEQRQLAVDYYTRSLEAYRTFGARSNQGKLLYKLAFLYFQAGDKAKAREYLPDALDIFRELEMPDLENASKLEKQLG